MSRKRFIRFIDHGIETHMRRLSIWSVIVCLGLTGPRDRVTAEEDTSPAGTKSFGGWTATCNNLGSCVAIATAEADGFFYVRIAREAGATSAPVVKLVLVSQDSSKGTQAAFSLQPETGDKAIGHQLGPYAGQPMSDDMSQISATLSTDSASLPFIEAIRDAETLRYDVLNDKGTLDLKGFAAALRWIDARQGRAGTPTALVAKGMTPIGQIPEPRPAPTIIPAPAGSAAEIAKPVLPQPALDAAAALPDCEADVVRAHENAEAWQLGPTTLVAVPCIGGAYNFSSALYFTDAQGTTARPVLLPQPATVDGGTSENVVTNMSFDPKTMILSEFAKGRGIGDCGEARSWVWTGRVFTLLDASRLDACPGALQDDWPNIYHAQRG
jgi:hypothetical protein